MTYLKAPAQFYSLVSCHLGTVVNSLLNRFEKVQKKIQKMILTLFSYGTSHNQNYITNKSYELIPTCFDYHKMYTCTCTCKYIPVHSMLIIKTDPLIHYLHLGVTDFGRSSFSNIANYYTATKIIYCLNLYFHF